MENTNDSHFLKVPFEALPSPDKDIIGRAVEEFQDKCLLSYSKNHDNKVFQKFSLPRVLLHGLTDTKDEDDRWFFTEAVHQSINDALKSHNTIFLNTF